MEFIESFKRYYGRFDQCDLEMLDNYYAESVEFNDPIHKIEGLSSLKQYFEEMCSGLEHCEFIFVGQTIDQTSAWLKWEMHYQHPKLNQGRLIALTGASYIKFVDIDGETKITSHEDFYDMGAMLYEYVPVLKHGVSWLKHRLAKTA